MPRYRIVEWDERYEVDDKGHDWKSGAQKRKGPLIFVRLKVHGRSQGTGWRKLLKKAGPEKALMVFGVFCKLLEIASDADHDNRNVIPETGGDDGLAFILDVPQDQLEFALQVLEDMRWVEAIPEIYVEIPGNPGISRPTNQPTNPTNSIQLNPTNPTNQTNQPNQLNTTRSTKWESVRGRVRAVVGLDGAVETALTDIGNAFMFHPDAGEDAADVILRLLPEVQKTATRSKAAYFLGMLKKRFSCWGLKSGSGKIGQQE